MEFIEFTGQSCVAGKNQPEYQPLPVHMSEDGRFTACCRLTPEEIFHIAQTGMVWFTVWTGGSITPICVNVLKPDWIQTPNENKDVG
jgi:hypothetical protein